MQSPEYFSPYRGPNRSHRRFRERFVNLNAVAYLVEGSHKLLHRKLSENVVKYRKHVGEQFALGVVSNAISASEIESIIFPGTDAIATVENFDGFRSMFRCQCLISAIRLIVDYCVDLLSALLDLRELSPNHQFASDIRDWRIKPKDIVATFDELGVPVSEDATVNARLQCLSATRNALEHNDSKVNDELLQLCPDDSRSVGDEITVGIRDVGLALALAESTVSSLNKRAIDEWPSLGECS